VFGVTEEDLIAGLDAVRRRLCGYGASLEETCDCKFGIRGAARMSEQTGCPELRQAIKMLQGKYEEIAAITQLTEQSAARTLNVVVGVLAKAGLVTKV
jgi:hypothetical protein